MVWDSDCLSCEVDETGIPQWSCKHGGCSWSGHNHTKALYHVGLHHVCKIPGTVIKPCHGVIPEDFARGYFNVFGQNVNGVKSRKARRNYSPGL